MYCLVAPTLLQTGCHLYTVHDVRSMTTVTFTNLHSYTTLCKLRY